MTILYPLSELYIFVLLLFAIHEGGHLLASKMMGLTIIEYRFSSVSVDWKNLEPSEKIFITLSGSIATAIVSLFLFAMGFGDFSLVSAIFTLLDLFPALGTDGQVIFRLIGEQRRKREVNRLKNIPGLGGKR